MTQPHESQQKGLKTKEWAMPTSLIQEQIYKLSKYDEERKANVAAE